MIKKLDEKLSQEFLEKQRSGHLACVLENGQPYIVPVNYLFRENFIYIHSLPGKKISAMEANPKVCFQTEKMSATGLEWQSVIVYGEYEEVEEKRKKTRILAEFFRVFPQFTPVEAKFEREYIPQDLIVFRIKIKGLTGVTESF
jgi:nitroimidazol reductase NimA-like FMN-containing flavoprotein (pyridoxamine 5'-phosphate oxidase superfamily)